MTGRWEKDKGGEVPTNIIVDWRPYIKLWYVQVWIHVIGGTWYFKVGYCIEINSEDRSQK